MTLQELKYLVAVTDYRHFGRAAAACHVTQPTLSAGLRSLENKVGRALCERGPQGVIIPFETLTLVDQARRVLAEARRLEEMALAGAAPLTGVFRLGAIPTIGPYLFPHLIPGVRKDWPDLRLHLVEAQTDGLLGALRRGDLDAVLLSPPVETEGLDCVLLYREEFELALPVGHSLLKRKRLNIKDLADESLLLLDEGHCLRDQVVEFCSIGSSAARDLLRASSLETLRNMVAAGIGVTLLPALALVPAHGGGVETRRLNHPVPTRDVGLYWRRQAANGGSVQLLANSVGKLLPKTVRHLV